jgi:hypothetical protein
MGRLLLDGRLDAGGRQAGSTAEGDAAAVAISIQGGGNRRSPAVRDDLSRERILSAGGLPGELIPRMSRIDFTNALRATGSWQQSRETERLP